MPEAKACHNCRRRRLRCDRSVPECHKCSARGQRCLGYGQLYRWADTVLIRGQPVKKTNVVESSVQECMPVNEGMPFIRSSHRGDPEDDRQNLSNIPAFSLADPLFQDLKPSSRHYLSYFASRFCQDLVIHDSPHHAANPFRELVPRSQTHPFLQHIIIATSAVHYSHTMRHVSSPGRPLTHIARQALVDALEARHRAIRELRRALGGGGAGAKAGGGGEEQQLVAVVKDKDGDNDALLATVLFFVNFSLIDSGREGWRDHMRAAGRLLVAARRPSPSRPLGVYDYVASDTVAYYIWSRALDSLASWKKQKTRGALPSDVGHRHRDWDRADILHILTRTEANSYHSCPARLLYIVLLASRAGEDNDGKSTDGTSNQNRTETLIRLLREAQSFDVDRWATEVCARNVAARLDTDELELGFRTHIAATYRAAVCLYIFLIAPSLQAEIHLRHRRQQHQQQQHPAREDENEEEELPYLPNTEDLAAAILHRLSFIPPPSPFFKYTTWPVFLGGVESASPARRAWVLRRLRAMRDFCPWGMLTAAMETLGEIWRIRNLGGTTAAVVGPGSGSGSGSGLGSDGGGGENSLDDEVGGEKIAGVVGNDEKKGGDDDSDDADDVGVGVGVDVGQSREWLAQLRSLDNDCLIV
ncbi:fungal-specific transcription factor domain-containing protein [Xylariomycetidae sp. FL2044]|nr:fungal-specific transcription factor domain-containing protein [Xylariomycetidae sp. FL2044]